MNRNVPSGCIMNEYILVEAQSILTLQSQETYLVPEHGFWLEVVRNFSPK